MRTASSLTTWLVALLSAAPPASLAETRATAAVSGPAPVSTPQARQPLTPDEEVDGCLACHGRDDLSLVLASGDTLSLHVDQKVWGRSSHKKLGCSDCHTDLRNVEGEHPKRPLKGRREFAIAYSEACKRCHFQNYTDTQGSVHHAQLARGKLAAAVCSDCHGAHDVSPPAAPRSKISRTCSTCHAAISAAYAKSVHGQALASGESEDTPACTDCHHAHDIADPRTGAWRVQTPDLCGGCHTSERLMAKYGLSTQVVQTYLSDFHGVTARFEQGEKEPSAVTAVCTDCHGVHDIARVKAPDSRVLRENLLATCKRCHAGARADFPASWLPHYEPTPSKAPLVWAVKLFYSFLVPFMVGGLLLQVILHLWRLVVNR
jgi:predicted CXXCH cytochrome family protein